MLVGICFTFLLAAGFCRWARAEAPRLQAARTAVPPSIDGHVDEPVWTAAPPTRAFTQKFPHEGAPPSETTEVRVLYDDTAVYVAIDCEQLRAPLALRLSRRDREIEADRVSVAISSRRDRRTAFEFGITASGVLDDGLYYDDTEYARDWDENWEGEVARTARGWSAELRIPLRILRFDALPTQDWGFNVRRFISAHQETSEWSLVRRTDAGMVSRFGSLENLVGLRPRRSVELRPFVLGEVTQLDEGFGPQTGFDQRLAAGVDAKAHPTQNLTLDVAINPDFGQVEADEVVLNLSTVETSYPEKRPFFLEGTDAFETYRPLVYTRRIGAVPAAPARRPDELVIERAQPAPIYGALKLVGRPVPGMALGALSAITGATDLRVRPALAGAPDEARVSTPLAAYNVLRLRGDFAGGSQIGFIATATNRFEQRARYPAVAPDPAAPPPGNVPLALCPGGQRVPPGTRCFRDAYVAGVDGLWRSPAQVYAVKGQLLASVLDGGPPRPQRDGTVLASGDVGPMWTLVAAKIGGNWVGDAGFQGTGRHTDINDLGFMERQNELRMFLNGAYRTTHPWGPTLSTSTGVELFQQYNFDGLLLGRLFQLYSEAQLRSFWEVEARLIIGPVDYEDREVGDGTALEEAAYLGAELQLRTDPRRRAMGELEARGEWLADGARYNASALLRLRLLPQLDVDLEPEVTFRWGEPRFLEREATLATTRYLFGDLAAASAGATLRLTWTFTPRLTLQTYAQVFLLSKRYSDFTAFQSPQPRPVIELRQLQPAAPPLEHPDQREGVFNANVLLRWEYRLGSTLFLVYTRSQHPLDQALLPGARGLDPRALARGPAANTLLLKLSYWWG